MRTKTENAFSHSIREIVGGARPLDALSDETRPEAAFHLASVPVAQSASRSHAFTFIELLAVVAVIGILTALLLPSVRSARVATSKAKTKVQFAEWTAAIGAFRNTYGYYPAFHGSGLVNPIGQNAAPATLHLFHDILAARRRDGSALPVNTSSTDAQFPEAQNRKLVGFHSFAESDLTTGHLLQDAFGNTEIAVLVDRNLDGVIRVGGTGSDYAVLPAVGGRTPSATEFPASGVRAGVLFYAPGPEETGFIFSWK
jgi:prepilin-type N-terminal cleavage/methylation domain-containing protein